MSNPTIELALEETVRRYCQTIAPGFHPACYAAKVKEADLVFHFVNALERHCALPVSYREFSCNGEQRNCGRKHGTKVCSSGRCGRAGGRRIDAVVVSADSIYLIEAKGTLAPGMLDDLDKQICDFEDTSYSLRFYLVNNIVRRFRHSQWGERSIRHLWGIILANTFREKKAEEWKRLDPGQYPVLASYTCAQHECLRYRDNNHQLFILSGYKQLSADCISYTGKELLS